MAGNTVSEWLLAGWLLREGKMGEGAAAVGLAGPLLREGEGREVGAAVGSGAADAVGCWAVQLLLVRPLLGEGEVSECE